MFVWRLNVSDVDIVTLNPLSADTKSTITSIIKEKLKRELKINAVVDSSIGGGIVVKFGSMTLDGSIREMIRVKSVELQGEVEARV